MWSTMTKLTHVYKCGRLTTEVKEINLFFLSMPVQSFCGKMSIWGLCIFVWRELFYSILGERKFLHTTSKPFMFFVKYILSLYFFFTFGGWISPRGIKKQSLHGYISNFNLKSLKESPFWSVQLALFLSIWTVSATKDEREKIWGLEWTDEMSCWSDLTRHVEKTNIVRYVLPIIQAVQHFD